MLGRMTGRLVGVCNSQVPKLVLLVIMTMSTAVWLKHASLNLIFCKSHSMFAQRTLQKATCLGLY